MVLLLVPRTLISLLLLPLLAFASYITILCLYNYFFHPYAKYPGPFWAKISPLYALWHAYAGDLHIDVLRCHEKYGSFVRYAPNRVVVNTVQGLRDIYGQGRNLQKSSGYAPHPYFPKVFNTHNCIDKTMHGRKRRIVSQGFSESAIASSERYVLDHVRNLCDVLTNAAEVGRDGWSVARDMGVWTNYFTLDVISDLTFGQSFDMIGKPDLRWLVDAIVSGNRHIYMRFAYPALFNVKPDRWYSPARWLFPKMADERAKFAEIADKYSRERMASMEEGKSDRQDIMSALLAARDPKTGEKLTDAEVWGEAHLMIAAGGDTTSTALAAVLFYLSRDRHAYNKLASEIRTTFSDVESIRRGKKLSSCQYLRACLDEAMRLAPAAPGALWREVCANGAMVDGQFIPAGYDVAVCTYALSHNPDYFPDPFVYRPERFLAKNNEGYPFPTAASSPNNLTPPISPTSSPLATPSTPFTPSEESFSAFAPFAIGPRSCLAKPLAYLELSLAIARIIWLTDFEAVNSTGGGGPGFGRGREREEEFQIVDMFSSNKQGPVLRFRTRLIDDGSERMECIRRATDGFH